MEIKNTLLTFLSILFCAVSFAQNVPQGINYQALARDSNGDIYDLVPAGLFPLERVWGAISPYYDGANPHMAPNFLGFNPTNSYIGIPPPFPIYNFIYHNLGGSDNVTLQITRISNE